LKFQTLVAHSSKSVSCVTPRSNVIASYSVRPGDLRVLLGSPPSRCLTTSVVRFSPVTLLTPATYFPSHLMRNLKFLYGSYRCGLEFTLNGGINHPFLLIALIVLRISNFDLSGHLLNSNDHEFGGLEWCKADLDIDDPFVDVALRRRLRIAFDKIGG